MLQASTDALSLFLPIVVDEESRVEFNASAAGKGSRTLLEFLLLPAAGGSFLLASTNSSASFRAGLQGLPLSRPIWRFARLVLGTLSRVGLHRFVGLKRVRISVDGQSGAERLDFSLQSGVPGGGQKLIAREHGPLGTLGAFWKIGQCGLPAELVQAECRALTWIAARDRAAGLAPKLLSSGSDERKSWLRMSAIRGTAVPAESAALVAGFTSSLAATEPSQSALETSTWHARIATRLDEIETTAPVITALCRKALVWLRSFGAGDSFHFHPAHGDLTPWNSFVVGDGLAAFDWEFFQADAPAGFDRFHWTIQVSILTLGESCEQVSGRLQEDFHGILGVKPTLGERYLAMYLVDALSREEHVFLSGRPSFPQVQWLIDCRTGLLERILG